MRNRIVNILNPGLRVARNYLRPVLGPIYSELRKTIDSLKFTQLRRSAKTNIQKSDWDRAVKKSEIILENLWLERSIQAHKYHLTNSSSYAITVKKYQKSRKNPKIAIFTAVTNSYEVFKPPARLDSRFDYFIFTDSQILDGGFLNVRPITYFSESSVKDARYVKTHPIELLPDYDYAIWVDASILITGDLYELFKKFKNSKTAIGAIKHPLRKNIYEEIDACIALRKDDTKTLKLQAQKYQNSKYDGSNLIESGLLFYDLKNQSLKRTLDTWWSEIQEHSHRDQISFGYALHQARQNWYNIMPDGVSVRNHPSFILHPHKSGLEDAYRGLLLSPANSRLINPYESMSKHSYASIKTVESIVCVHNAPKETLKCINSIEKYKINNLILTIVDDGSMEETKLLLESWAENKKWVRLIRNEKASGYTKAANKGLRQSTGDFVVLINSDVVVTRNWSEKLLKAVTSSPGIGIVGPLSNAASVQSIPEFKSKNHQTAINDLPAGVSIEKMNKLCEEWSYDIFPRVPLIHGFCFGLTRDTINKLGYFDESNFPNGYGEENDYCLKAGKAGIGMVVATDTYIYHSKSKSYDTDSRIKFMEKGSEALTKLYGKELLVNSIVSMQKNPLLERMRNLARELY